MPDVASPRVMVAILTLNEAARLPGCLAAIPSHYPVTVVDSGSSDQTVDIARQAGARVLINPWPGFAAQRNFCLAACRDTADWVLFIDADEIFPPALFAWIDDRLRLPDPGFDVVMFPSWLVLNGQTLRHAPGYPILHHRLLKVGQASFVDRDGPYSETVSLPARIAHCPIPYHHHFHNGSLLGWLYKHVNIAARETHRSQGGPMHLTARTRLSRMVGDGPLRIPLRFLYHYVWRGGFRDGRAGLLYATMYAWHEATKWLLKASADQDEPHANASTPKPPL